MSRSYLTTTVIAKWCETQQTGPFTTGASLILTTLWEVFLCTFYRPRALRLFAQGRTVSEWQRQNLNSTKPVLEPPKTAGVWIRDCTQS